MNKEAKIAEKVAASAGTRTRNIDISLQNAVRMISDGGRGIELGIREVEDSARYLDRLAKELRRIQSSGRFGNSVQADMLEAMEGTR